MAVSWRCDVFVIPRATNRYFRWLLPTYQQTKTWSVIRLVLSDIRGGYVVIHCAVLPAATLMAL